MSWTAAILVLQAGIENVPAYRHACRQDAFADKFDTHGYLDTRSTHLFFELQLGRLTR